MCSTVGGEIVKETYASQRFQCVVGDGEDTGAETYDTSIKALFGETHETGLFQKRNSRFLLRGFAVRKHHLRLYRSGYRRRTELNTCTYTTS